MVESRLFKSPDAYGLVMEGDSAACSQWLGYAQAQLRGILARQKGSTSVVLFPASGVEIRIDARPNKISIKAGGVYLTVEDVQSALDTARTNDLSAPFRTRLSSLVMKSINSIITWGDKKYAGGYLQSRKTVSSRYGGYWQNGVKALSWVTDSNYGVDQQEVFFIGGKYGAAQVNGAMISSACLVSVAMLQARFPTAANIDTAEYGIAALYTDGTMRLFIAYPTLVATDKPTKFLCQQLSSLSVPEVGGVLSGFTKNGLSVAALKTYDASYRQTVEVFKFSADYTSYTLAMVYDKNYYRYSKTTAVTSTITDGFNWSSTEQVTISLIAGEPLIESIKAEGNSFSCYRYGVSSSSSSSSKVSTVTGGVNPASKVISVTSSSSSSGACDVISVSDTTWSVSQTLPSDTSSSSYSFSHSDTGLSSTRYSMARSSGALYYSAPRRFAILGETQNEVTETSSSAPIGGGLWGGSTSTSTTNSYQYRSHEVAKAPVTIDASSTSSNTTVAGGGGPPVLEVAPPDSSVTIVYGPYTGGISNTMKSSNIAFTDQLLYMPVFSRYMLLGLSAGGPGRYTLNIGDLDYPPYTLPDTYPNNYYQATVCATHLKY